MDFVELDVLDDECFYIYDERMLLHDDKADFPECPLRIKAIHDYLEEHYLLEGMTRLDIVESEIIERDGKNLYPMLETVHTREQIAQVESMSKEL